MDDVETSSERALATASLELIGDRPVRVLVGGLGLGFTAQALLADSRVRSVDVIEIEPALVEWCLAGLIPSGEEILADPRVNVIVSDVADVICGETQTYDLVLLDVDNGPDNLVIGANAGLYDTEGLAACARILRPDGWLTVWSATAAETLAASMRDAFAHVCHDPVPVRLGGRAETYWLLAGQRGPTT